VEYEGRSVVISGDTNLSKNLINKARGVDLIIHEVMAVDDKLLKGSALLQDILTGHTPPEDAGILFRDIKPKMAVFNHIIRIRASDEAIETATRKTYSGPLKVGRDLMTFVVDDEVSLMNR
jgi:ribonuclease Z